MSLTQFNLATLAQLDGGKAALTFEKHLRRAANDCVDRPGDPSARVVTLTIALTPVMEPEADGCSEVRTQFSVTSKVPTHKSRLYSLGLRQNGQLLFNPDSPTNVNQPTLLDDLNEDD